METPNREPQEYDRNLLARILIVLLHSYYILEVPCVGFPLKAFALQFGKLCRGTVNLSLAA